MMRTHQARAIIAGLLLWASGASAQTSGRNVCPPYTTPVKLNFTTENTPTTYSNAYNVTGIQTIMRRRGHVIAGAHQRALGVTSSEIGLSMEARTTSLKVSSGYCVYLTSVDVRFGYQSMEVYIASEYRPQTCEYRVILDHENQHVAINRNGIREYAPRLRQVLEQRLQRMEPRFTANAQVSTDRKLSDLKEALDPTMDELQSILARRNAVIDNDNNYAAVAEMCKNWDQGNVWPVQPRPQQ
jgi:hypothetical protein